jgi:NAD(P)-dependent dehydrogenase (short-subunit alcohol dehydrogenase family)
MERLANRVCLVTGSTGIAGAAARRLASEGAAVFVVSRTPEHAAGLAEEIRAAGGRAAAAAADLREADAVAGAVTACRAAFGRIDGLFAVAGGSGRAFGDGPLHRLTPEGWEETLALNLRTQALVCRAVLQAMVEQAPTATGSRGALLLMSSILALAPSPGYFATHAYTAAKGAILSLTRALAAYYAPYQIRVNAVAPALTTSRMSVRAAADPATVAFARWKQPLAGGLLDPEAVAHAAVYFLSDESRYVTGQILQIDGGWGVTGEPWLGESEADQ